MNQRSMRMAASRAWRAGAVVAVGLASLLTVPAALGQPGGGGFRGGGPDGMFGPPISNRDLDVYTEVLELTPDQEEAAKALLQGYQESYQQQAQAMRDKMEAARESGGDNRGPGNWEQMRKGFEELRQSRKKAEESFVSDLKTVLTPEQMERWPRAEREVRREKTIGRGMLSGEAVDVVQTADEAVDSLPEGERAAVRETLKPVLEQYSQDLDRELVARNETFESGMTRGGELMAAGDMDGVQKLFEKSREASDRVREVNQRYARQVEALLPDAAKAEFQDAVRKASFPEVYRETYAKRVLAAAAGFKDLDESQRAGLQAITEGYNRDLTAVNEKMTAGILDREKNMTMRDMFRGRGGPGGGPGGGRGGQGELMQARRDLDDSTIENLKKLLTPEQIAKLPERQQRGGRGGPNGDSGRPDDGGDSGAQDRPRRRTF